MNNAQYINQDSGKTEYYTPKYIIDVVREFYDGVINLDPCTTVQANKLFIQAEKIYTKEDNGLNQKWEGNVWVNHPFSKENNPLWVNKMLYEYVHSLNIILCITYAATSEKWFQPLFRFQQCFLSPRTNYCDINGKAVKGCTKGSVITNIGGNKQKFIDYFSYLGQIK